MEIYLDGLTAAQLQERYGIGKTQYFERKNALGLDFPRLGNKSVATGEQIQIMDELHDLLQNGWSIAESLERMGLALPATSSAPSTELPGLPAIVQLVAAIAALVPAPDVLRKTAQLQTASEHGWQLDTRQLTELLGHRLPVNVPEFTERGFTFTCVGKIGRARAWVVSRAQGRHAVRGLPAAIAPSVTFVQNP